MKGFFRKVALGSGALVAGSAFATGPDVTAVTTAIGDAATAGASIGAAVLIMVVGIKLYKWVKGAM
jgi:hypothetical protein